MKQPSLAITLSAEASYQLGDPVLLTFQVENTETETCQLLVWGTPLEDAVHADFIKLQRGDQVIPYDGPLVYHGEPSALSYIVLAPGARAKRTIDISTAYPIHEPGVYTAALKGSIRDAFSIPGPAPASPRPKAEHKPYPLQAQSVTFEMVGSPQRRRTLGEAAREKEWEQQRTSATAKAPSLNGGTATEQATTILAHNNAQYLAALCASQLAKSAPASNAVYQDWFGAFEQGRYNAVKKHFGDVDYVLNAEQVTYDLSCDGCESDWNAYTHHGARTVHLCSGFWGYSALGHPACQASIVLHEWTHAVSSTDDNDCYGEADCLNLATTDPGKAISTADCHECFATHILDSDFGTSFTLITDRSTFGADEVKAMLTPPATAPARVENAFYVVAGGYWADKLGITTVGSSPNVEPAITLSPAIPGMQARLTTLQAEDPSLPDAPQRFTWVYRIEFTDATGFPTTPGGLTIVTLTATLQGRTSTALLHLVCEPNPYELDGPTSWLSTDLRVFQIREGETRFNAPMGSTEADAPVFIQTVIGNLNGNTAGTDTFDSIPEDPEASALELADTVDGLKVFNFAIAKVRYKGTIDISDVRVFFRLFNAETTSVAYDPDATYRRLVQGANAIPQLGVNADGNLLTIPCFAEARQPSFTLQTDTPNVRTIVQQGASESVAYFGCWLDMNQTTPRYPVSPGFGAGPWSSGLKSMLELMRNAHQCLVAEIAFDPDPITPGESPGTSENLAQRNLTLHPIPNPGDYASRSVPVTFEIRSAASADTQADELMFEWGNVPAGAFASLYLPALNAADLLATAQAMYGKHRWEQVDEHTIRCAAVGVTYLPMSTDMQADCIGLMTLDLPGTVHKGDSYTVVVRQITNAEGEPPPIIYAPRPADVAAGSSTVYWRKILGSFQVTVPVKVKDDLLEPEMRRLAVLRWIQKSIPANDRWRAVFDRYVTHTADRVDALGGDSKSIDPSPSGVDVPLRLRILDEAGAFYGKPVDIEIKHRTLASEPRQELHHIVPTNVVPIRQLRRFPQSDYIVTVTPSHHFHPHGQFVTIPPSGTAELTFIFGEHHREAPLELAGPGAAAKKAAGPRA